METVKTHGVSTPAPTPCDRTIAFGEHPRQAIEFWAAKGESRAAPVVIYIHGGAWRSGDRISEAGYWKPKHATERGLAFASIGYRLVPKVTIDEQLDDLARGVRTLIDCAAELGIDPTRLILTGHSSGAHLASMLGADERILSAHGVSLDAVLGVLSNDGSSFDVERQLPSIHVDWRGYFEQALGVTPEVQRQRSPIWRATPRNVRDFLLLHMKSREANDVALMTEFAAVLRKNGSAAEVRSIDASHNEINLWLGEPGREMTEVVDAWLDRILSAR